MEEKGENRENYYDEYEIDLREYILLLWDNKIFIAALVIFAVAAAFLISNFIISPQYVSEATIIAPNLKLINGNTIVKEEYISILSSDEIMKEILEIANKNREEKIKRQKLLDLLSYNLNEDTNEINFSFKFNNPKQTQMILDEWLVLFINGVEQYVNNINDSYYESVDSKFVDDYNLYQKNLDKLKKFEGDNNIGLLKKQLAEKENRTIKLNSNIIDLKNELDSKEEKRKYISSRIKNTNQYLSNKSLIDDEILQKINNISYEQDIFYLFDTEEFLNPEYSNLINREIDLSVSMKSKKIEITNYKKDKKKIDKEIITLQRKISELSEKRAIIENNLVNSKKNYQNSNDKLNQIKQKLAEKNYNLIILSSPYLPENPVSPNTKLNIAIAAVLALMVAVFIVFFREFMKEE